MNILKVIWISFVLSIAGSVHAKNFDAIEIQLFAQQQMENRLDGGFFKFIDFERQQIVKSVLIDSHPIMFKGDDLYVVCVTVADESGSEYPVDIYISEIKGVLLINNINVGDVARGNFRKIAKAGLIEKM